MLSPDWELTAYKASIHSRHQWGVFHHSARHKHQEEVEQHRHQRDVETHRAKSRAVQQQLRDCARSKDRWKQTAGREATARRNANHSKDRVTAAMDRLSNRLHKVCASRNQAYQQCANLKRKKSALVESGRWDLRAPTASLLTKKERRNICIQGVLKRVKVGGKYSDLTLNYGPKIIQDYGLSANNLRPMLRDIFAWFVTEDEVPEFKVPHRTTVSRHAVARNAVLKKEHMSALEDGEVTFITGLADGSKRDKKDHEPAAATYSSKHDVHQVIMRDSVTGGKTGVSQAEHVFTSFSPAAQPKLGAMLYDTTSSNTGEFHGLGAELDRLTELDLMFIRCTLHVLSLLMVAFGTTLLGEAPSLHWGVNTPPHAIALMLFLRYVENREWKDLHEAYEMLWGYRFTARTQCVFSRWKYVFWAAIETRYRWGVTKAMELLKTTWLTDPNATGSEVPPVQPIATVGCGGGCSPQCRGHNISAVECSLPTGAAKVERKRHTDPVAQPRQYCSEARVVAVQEDEQTLNDDAADLDEAAEAPIDWNHQVTEDECEDFFASMFAANEDGGGDNAAPAEAATNGDGGDNAAPAGAGYCVEHSPVHATDIAETMSGANAESEPGESLIHLFAWDMTPCRCSATL